jgi:Cu2+-containing amine oxidase
MPAKKTASTSGPRSKPVTSPATRTDAITVARTIEASASDVFRAFNDPTRRSWCFTTAFRVLAMTAPRSLRVLLPDASMVQVFIARKGNVRSAVTITHSHLADDAAVEQARANWRDALARLAEMLSE